MDYEDEVSPNSVGETFETGDRDWSPSFELEDGSYVAPNYAEDEDFSPYELPGPSDLSDEELARELQRRYPQYVPSYEEPSYGQLPFEEEVAAKVTERQSLGEEILEDVWSQVPGIELSDLAYLRRMLRSPQMTAQALRQLRANGALVTQAKGLVFDRLQRMAASTHEPAPLTPGGMWSRDGLEPEERDRLERLADRLGVPYEDLKSQYLSNRRRG